MKKYIAVAMLAACTTSWIGCTKSVGTDDQNEPYILSYGDSILHLQPTGDNIVRPTIQRPGSYSGFPEGIEIDQVTGAINIESSETGLRYRITHTAPDGKITETKVVLAGITFKDHIYYLSAGDSIAHPVYNADVNRSLPLAGSSFDEGDIANGGGCSVKTDNGKINLKETIRNGVFRLPPRNDEQQTFEIKYRINDKSGKSLNKLKVLLYWYNTVNDIPQYVWDILNERVTQGVFLRGGTGAALEQLAKPRPPCVVIVDH
jgi:hypothetical protein